MTRFHERTGRTGDDGMLYFSESQIDQWLLDDISLGDLTTRSAGIGGIPGRMRFFLRKAGCASGIAPALLLLRKLGLQTLQHAADGDFLQDGALLVTAEGRADALHMGWKAAQNILEWSSGVSQYTSLMIREARRHNPDIHVACTRKSIPGTKALAAAAVVHGGGIIHRGGTAETVLLFANHRRFLSEPDNWATIVERLRRAAPEKKIAVEADSMEEAIQALSAGPDILQLDKFSPDDIRRLTELCRERAYSCVLCAAGGISLENVGTFAATGVSFLVTSAPYYAKPADIKVVLEPS